MFFGMENHGFIPPMILGGLDFFKSRIFWGDLKFEAESGGTLPFWGDLA